MSSSATTRRGGRKLKGVLACAVGALVIALAGCGAFPYANQTVLAQVTSIEGTHVTADILDEASMAEGNGAEHANVSSYERQADEVFRVGDESVYATDAENLHPTTQSGAASEHITIENGALANAPEGVSLENGTLVVESGGAYTISGSLEGAIDITTTDEVRLVLDGFQLTGSETPLVSSNGNLVLELGAGSNRIACEGTVEDAEAVASALQTQGALFIEGAGELEMVAPGRAISAQTMLALDGGSLTVTSGDDALFSASDLRISGGALTADAGDDVAHGDFVTVIEGGTITGNGKEGIEAERIYLRDGAITLTTSDDGVNAAEPEAHDDAGAPEGCSETESCLIAIGGGTLSIDAKGDGIDSNGSVEVRGGTTTVSSLAPNSGEANAPLDYEVAAVLTGGSLLMVGDGSMAQGFTEADQAYVLCQVSGEAGQEVALEANGTTLASMTAAQDFNVAIATAPGLTDGESVQVSVAGQAIDVTATTEAQSGMGMPGASGQPPATPEGEEGVEPPSGEQGSAPEPPSGDAQGNATEPPAMPSEGQAAPQEPPSGEANGNGSTPEPPSDATADDEQHTPPEPPSGEQPTGETPQGEQNAAPEPPNGEQPELATTGGEISFEVSTEQAETLEVGDIVRITFGASATAEELEIQNGFNALPNMGNGPAMGGQSEDFGTAATTFDTDVTIHDEEYTSTSADENAIRVTNGAAAVLGTLGVTKTGDSTNTDASNFYGMNAGILANEGSEADIADTVVTTDATGANGIFSYGEGTTVIITNTKIRTSGDSSGGIETAGGATTIAGDLDIETQGASSAAIRSDRGGGTVDVDGGSYVTHGTGSPAIYSTANVSVHNATLTATSSEAVVVEGKNSVALTNCDTTGSMTGTNGEGSGENLHGVMIYQSMSGDAEVGEASFEARGGSLATTAGDLFYVTNTTCTIELADVELGLADGALLRVAGNDGSRGWGQSGSNGGTCTFTAIDQQLKGAIVVDEISSLSLTLTGESSFEGTINADGTQGTVDVTLTDGTWTLTGDSYVSSFEGDLSHVAANGHHLFVNGEQVL